jgi:hypothetical protein
MAISAHISPIPAGPCEAHSQFHKNPYDGMLVSAKINNMVLLSGDRLCTGLSVGNTLVFCRAEFQTKDENFSSYIANSGLPLGDSFSIPQKWLGALTLCPRV